VPIASVSQHVAAIASRFGGASRAPRHRHQQVGERQRAVERTPVEVQRLDRSSPATRKATTRPTFDGLKTCEPRVLDDVLGEQGQAGHEGEDVPVVGAPGSPALVSVVRRMSARLPVSIALAGHTNMLSLRKVSATSMTAQVTMAAMICGTVTRNPSATWLQT
jgi:chemotaxis response regulator CheB